eukprot:5897598-Alexandrium_andersonii.AAC.1
MMPLLSSLLFASQCPASQMLRGRALRRLLFSRLGSMPGSALLAPVPSKPGPPLSGLFGVGAGVSLTSSSPLLPACVPRRFSPKRTRTPKALMFVPLRRWLAFTSRELTTPTSTLVSTSSRSGRRRP